MPGTGREKKSSIEQSYKGRGSYDGRTRGLTKGETRKGARDMGQIPEETKFRHAPFRKS